MLQLVLILLSFMLQLKFKYANFYATTDSIMSYNFL